MRRELGLDWAKCDWRGGPLRRESPGGGPPGLSLLCGEGDTVRPERDRRRDPRGGTDAGGLILDRATRCGGCARVAIWTLRTIRIGLNVIADATAAGGLILERDTICGGCARVMSWTLRLTRTGRNVTAALMTICR